MNDEYLLQQIKQLSPSNLQSLLEEPDAVDTIADIYPSSTRIQIQTIVAQNLKIIESISQRIDELREKHRNLSTLESAEEKLRKELAQAECDMMQALQPFSRTAAIKLVTSRIQSDTERTDEITKSMMNKEADHVKLCEQFLNTRIKMKTDELFIETENSRWYT